jgi:hypothetical protein
MSSLVKQDGGSVMADLQNLAIPFALLLAKNGLDYISKKGAAPQKPTKGKVGVGKRSKKVQRGGEVNSDQVVDLQKNMKAYLGGFK